MMIKFQMWVYEYFPMISPPLRQPGLDLFPTGMRWRPQNWVNSERTDFLVFRELFGRLSSPEVRLFYSFYFNVWLSLFDLSFFPDYLDPFHKQALPCS